MRFVTSKLSRTPRFGRNDEEGTCDTKPPQTLKEPERYISQRLTSHKQKGVDVVLGGQWGDEGKGNLVDMLSLR